MALTRVLIACLRFKVSVWDKPFSEDRIKTNLHHASSLDSNTRTNVRGYPFCTSTYIGSRINSNWSIANIQTTKDSLVVAIRDALHVRLRFRLLSTENSACGSDGMIFLRGYVFSLGNFTMKMKKVVVVSCVCVRSIFEYRGHVINSIHFKVQSSPREIHPCHAQLYAIRRNP